MTQDEKDIIYKDACCRLPYRPYAAYTLDDGTTVQVQLTGVDELAEYYGYISDTWGRIPNFDIKLYLRSMSSMTDKEKQEFYDICTTLATDKNHFMMEGCIDSNYMLEIFNWLNKHHFNYRLPDNLFIEAPEEMYNIKN